METVRIVLFYNGGFVTPKLTGVREYVGKDTMKRIKVEVEKLSVRYIRNMFDIVVGESDKLYYLCNGVSPRGGYKQLVSDDQIPEIVHVATKAYGAGVIRLHLYHVNGDGDDYVLCENEGAENVGAEEVGGFEGATHGTGGTPSPSKLQPHEAGTSKRGRPKLPVRKFKVPRKTGL